MEHLNSDRLIKTLVVGHLFWPNIFMAMAELILWIFISIYNSNHMKLVSFFIAILMLF
jgi:hypothetical protein